MAYLALIVEDVVINKRELTEEITIIGRTKDCDLQIDDQSVSSKHARVLLEDDPYLPNSKSVFLEDLKSTNGTKVNGKSITKEKLSDGDKVTIGFTHFQFVANQDNSLDETAVIVS